LSGLEGFHGLVGGIQEKGERTKDFKIFIFRNWDYGLPKHMNFDNTEQVSQDYF
jgi:hypothetical protein